MKNKITPMVFNVGLIVFAVLSVCLFLNKDNITITPWNTTGSSEWLTYASGNGNRTVIIENSEKSVIVLDSRQRLVYRLDAEPRAANSFTNAKYVDIDEYNNIYICDANFGGAFHDNVERVLKYSEKGEFIGEIYSYRYTNKDFIITVGKISGITYFNDSVYLLRLGDEGFWLERAKAAGNNEVEEVAFFDYPNAFRDLLFFNINAERQRLSVSTKSGTVKQFDFIGNLVYEWRSGSGRPYTVVSDNNDNLMYADIITGEIISINTATNNRSVLFAEQEENAYYYYCNYTDKTLFVASSDSILTVGEDREFKVLNSYFYSAAAVILRIVLFLALIVDVALFLVASFFLVRFLRKKKLSEIAKRILLVGMCIAFGTAISSILIVNEMNKRYNTSTFANLENVSRLVAASIDTDVLTALSSPTQFDSDEYLHLNDTLKTLFAKLQFTGNSVYQMIWMVRDDVVYSMYDLENALGVFYPFDKYRDDSYYKEVFDTSAYTHSANVTDTGGWIFACGPIYDTDGNVVALIETGYNMQAAQEQMRSMVIQTLLIVAAAAIAFLLIMIEFILISSSYKKTKLEKLENKKGVFHPELLRTIVFFQYTASNLATALLPMYAAKLYKPVFSLPKELVVTLPFTTEVIASVFALLVIPHIIQKLGLKKICIMGAGLFFVGNVLCFIAPSTLLLAVAYAFMGFAGGAIILVVNTIIGAQKDENDVNSGFAHFNASYLGGINVGVVFGSILAQFFPYRGVFLFSSIIAVGLLGIIVFSVRSKLISSIYSIEQAHTPADDRKDTASFVKFIFSPIILCVVFLVLLPYVISMSFTYYFLPIYGTENGLHESNIGQLILLSGLFAILFGTSLCKYATTKFKTSTIIAFSLLLNGGAIYLFSVNTSVSMLIIAIVIMAVANIFALTNIQTYYTSLYNSANIASTKAVSFYSGVEYLATAIGPALFSYILVGEIASGMKVVSIGLIVALVLFLLVINIINRLQKSRR